jgi:hypothetical protein
MNVFFRLAVGPVFFLGSIAGLTEAYAAVPLPLVAPAAPRDRIRCLGHGGFVDACKGQYGRERTGLEQEMAALRAQAQSAQAILDKHQTTLTSFAEGIASAKAKIAFHDQEMPQKERLLALLNTLIGEKFDQADRELNSFSRMNLRSKGKALVSLREFLNGSASGLNDRLLEIETKLGSPGLSSVEIEALRFEQRTLRRIKSSMIGGLTSADFDGLVSQLRRGKVEVADVAEWPTDLVALIRSLVEVEIAEIEAEDISSRVQSLMSWLKSKLVEFKTEVTTQVSSAKTERASLQSRLAVNESSYSEWRDYLDNLRIKRDQANATYRAREARYASTAMLLECCDDSPYCKANGWEDYENRVNNRGNDDCR